MIHPILYVIQLNITGMGPMTHLDETEFPNIFGTIWRKPIILVLGFSGNLGGLIIGLLGGKIDECCF